MKLEVFKALDHLYCDPLNPIYSKIIKDGFVVGWRIENMIHICKQTSFVTATPHPNDSYLMLVFGKYPVYGFLLEPVGCIVFK